MEHSQDERPLTKNEETNQTKKQRKRSRCRRVPSACIILRTKGKVYTPLRPAVPFLFNTCGNGFLFPPSPDQFGGEKKNSYATSSGRDVSPSVS
mmetsp:Transcript_14871/g.30027  ORF Transcript_14871/g.30027 Transcript_14871/m.30027 type:complete len:94 (+) Transcript_14871:536-817(+)